MEPNKRMLFVVGVVFLLLAGACVAPAPPTPVPPPGPQDLVEAFQAAYNQHDTNGLLALLIDDVHWNFGFAAAGLATVRNITEYQFEINTRLELSNCVTKNGGVVCELAATDDCMPPEANAKHFVSRFAFSEGKISVVWSKLIDATSATNNLARYNSNRRSWASQSLPADTAKYAASGSEWTKFRYTAADSEWSKFRNADQAGTLSAGEFGQLIDQVCHAYAEAGE